MQIHYSFSENMEEEEQSFMKRIHNFAPKKSFLELQKIAMNLEPENDLFLSAIGKIRKEQDTKQKEEKKRETLREKNASRWKEILDRKEI